MKLRPLSPSTVEQDQLISELRPHAAEPGFRFLVDYESQRILEPATLYLYAVYGQDGLVRDENHVPSVLTNRQAAYELAEWHRYIHHLRVVWDRIDQDVLVGYARYLAITNSPHKHRPLERESINHKFTSVYGFYRWTNAAGLTSLTWDPKAISAAYKRGKRERRLSDDDIRPFSADEILRIQADLGPEPSGRDPKDRRSSRDRLVFEVGRQTGARREEICHIRARAIGAMSVDRDKPNRVFPLVIEKTKGRAKRTIAVPSELVRELQLYIRGERAAAVELLKTKGAKDHGRLFVNLPGSNRPAAPMSTGTVDRRFSELMRRLGMTRAVEKIIDGASIEATELLHSFHDTRHTYAVTLYVALRRENQSEPWKQVQLMLGHESWVTTLNYYLRAVGEYEAEIGQRTSQYLKDD